MSEMLKKYTAHKSSAKSRGIEFDLTFDEWSEIWAGKFHLRGLASDQLGMLRTRDEGGYTVDNVRLGTPKENAHERAVAAKVKRAGFTSGAKKDTSLLNSSWLGGRNEVFKEYVEEDE